MTYMKKILVTLLIMPFMLSALALEHQAAFNVRFPVAESTLSAEFSDNAESMAAIVAYLDSLNVNPAITITSVTFCGAASPDGAAKLNQRLAAERRQQLEAFVLDHASIPDSIISRCDTYIPWEYLAVLVEESDASYKDEAIDLIRNFPEYTYNKSGKIIDGRKHRLMRLNRGNAWRDMSKNFFGDMRNASAVFITVEEAVESEPEPEPEPVVVEQVTVVEPVVAEPEPIAEPVAAESRPLYMALKTNMLYDLAAVPNVGIEFYLGKNWSIGANWEYAWWNTNSRHRYWRVYGGELNLRRWFGKAAAEKPLTGHHLGISAQLFTYDFEWGGRGYMAGKPGGNIFDKTSYAVGLEYGYSLPIARRLNIDFSLALGYAGGTYYEYIPYDGHYLWQATKQRKWFGPTKAEVSLVWLIGNGNVNKKKGGSR